MATAWGFTGRRQDRQDLGYHRFRYYQNRNAIWLAPDPVRTIPGTPRYWYGDDSPTGMTDGSGGMAFADSSSKYRNQIDRAIANALVLISVELNSAKTFQYATYVEPHWYSLAGQWQCRNFDWGQEGLLFGAALNTTTISVCDDFSVGEGARARTRKTFGGYYQIELAQDFMGNDDDRLASTVMHELIHVALWDSPESTIEARVPTWSVNLGWKRNSPPSVPRNNPGEYVDELTEVVAYTAEAIVGAFNPHNLVPVLIYY
jgi:RHS repeat-associated protein